MTAQPISAILTIFGIESVELIRTNMQRNNRNATGETSQSIQWQLAKPNRLVVDGAPYIFALETGRAPRKSTVNSGLRSKILRWVQARNVTFQGKTQEQTASFITFYINKYGTKLWREGGTKDIITPTLNERRFEELNKELSDNYINEVLKNMSPYVVSN
jgi:hypothetical protein